MVLANGPLNRAGQRTGRPFAVVACSTGSTTTSSRIVLVRSAVTLHCFSGAPALPMPARISNLKSLAPFFAHLRINGTFRPSKRTELDQKGVPGAESYNDVELLDFEIDALYSDGSAKW